MEGVGARLGRSSSRYGTTTVFNGPVRKWKKDWVPINPSSSSSSSSSSNHHQNNHNHNNNNNNNPSSVNGSSTVSHLRLYKWTPLNNKDNNNSNENNTTTIATTNNNNSNSKINSNKKSKINGVKNNNNDKDDGVNGVKDSSIDDDSGIHEPPRRKFKYIPIAVLEEQKKESEENTDDEDEVKLVDSEDNTGEQASKSDGDDEKPDINDVPMEENQVEEENQTPSARQDLNELDLSLGLTSHDEDHDSDSKTDAKTDAQLESSNPGA